LLYNGTIYWEISIFKKLIRWWFTEEWKGIKGKCDISIIIW